MIRQHGNCAFAISVRGGLHGNLPTIPHRIWQFGESENLCKNTQSKDVFGIYSIFRGTVGCIHPHFRSFKTRFKQDTIQYTVNKVFLSSLQVTSQYFGVKDFRSFMRLRERGLPFPKLRKSPPFIEMIPLQGRNPKFPLEILVVCW